MFLAAKQKLLMGDQSLNPTSKSQYRETIQMLSKTLSHAGDELNSEAQEHVHLFHLLGDPLLRVVRPNQIQLSVETEADGLIRVRGTSPHAGTLKAELVYCRDRFQKRPPRRPEFKWDDQSLDSYAEVYRESNRKTVTEQVFEIPAGGFEFQLEVPDWARGRCVVRGYLQEPETKRFALGSSELNLKRR